MPIERERKFKLNKESLLLKNSVKTAACEILQAYIVTAHDRYVRVRRERISGKEFYSLGVKVIKTPDVRVEVEIVIDREAFVELYNECTIFIKKERVTLLGYPGKIFYSIDTFHDSENPESTISFVEAELREGVSEFPEALPDFCGEEITGKPEFTNIALASRVKIPLG